MQGKLKIVGLDCPNCARALQNEINKIEGVKNAHIEFVKNSLTFESDNIETATQKIIALTKELEPQAKITGKGISTKKNKLELAINLTTLTVGIVLGVLLLTLKVPTWAFWTMYVISALLLGYKTYYKAVRLLFKGIINENLLITISVIGASFVSEHLEGLMVIALYSIGKIFENMAVERSRRSIESLARMQPEYAVVVLPDGTEERVEPSAVKVGSIIIVRPGEKVALDGVVETGTSNLNTQSLTGESVPVSISAGATVLSGSIVVDGVLKIKTTSEYKNSAISKIMNLVENATEHKSKTETFISRLTKWYTLGVVVLAVLVFGIVFAVTKDFNSAIYRGLIFLVISCPCAFAISVPLSYFSGLGNASKNGVLIKGSNYLDVCARLNTVAFDKTGTLTTGEFKIDQIKSFDDSRAKNEILHLAALGERYSLHPLAKAIVAAEKNELEPIKNVKEKAGEGVEFVYNKKTIFVGRRDKTLENTTVEVYENDKKIGEIILSDTIKPSAVNACAGLNKLNIKTVMLSGDNINVAKKVGEQVGVSEAHGGLLPEDKFNYITQNESKQNVLGYVGDGINDAPSLAAANVGISMGINGSPASIEASDIVLVDDNPEKIITAIKISKYTKKIVIENIVFSAVVKIAFLALGAFGITGMLAAVFADVGVTLIAILNSLRALKYKAK